MFKEFIHPTHRPNDEAAESITSASRARLQDETGFVYSMEGETAFRGGAHREIRLLVRPISRVVGADRSAWENRSQAEQ